MRLVAHIVSVALLTAVSGCASDPVAGADDPGADSSPTRDAITSADTRDPGDARAEGGDDASVASDASDAKPAVDASVGGDAAGGSDPSLVGPYAVTKSSATVGKATLVSFVPALPTGTRAPLVILKHGFQLATANYAVLAERVASHGFIVVGVDTAGGLFGGPTNVDERDASTAAIDWALATAPFAATVDGEHVAVMGHSRGGKVAVMVAVADARIDAALLLDPVDGCGPGASYSATCPNVASAAFAGALKMPVGVMGETNNATGGFMPCAPAAQNYTTIYDGLKAASWAVEWTFTGADHMDFTDDGGGTTGGFCTDGPGDDATIRLDVHTLAVAFLRRHLRGEAAMDVWLVGASLPAGITHRGP
ncbi:MAG: alpha/beta hydrolase [Polyangiales bacterium]